MKVLIIVCQLVVFALGSFGGKECDSEKHVYKVSKNGHDNSNCSEVEGPQTFPCASLSYLVNSCNDSNMTIYLLDQEVDLNQVLVFDSVKKGISIIGNNSDAQPVVIHCGLNAGFFFSSSSGITLYNLKFIGCYFDVSELLNTTTLLSRRTAILFQNAFGASIKQCTFESKFGSAVILEDVHDFNISESTFLGNSSFVNEDESRSGGIIVRYTSSHRFNESIAISNCSFSSCYSMIYENLSQWDKESDHYYGYGGAIQIFLSTSNSSISISISDSNFSENKAIGGGAVGVLYLSRLYSNSVAFLNSYFTSNYGIDEGGAVLFASTQQYSENLVEMATSSMNIFIDSCIFSKNYAMWGGGLASFINSCQYCGNCINIRVHSSTWEHNQAELSGFALALDGPDNWYNVAQYEFRVYAFLTGKNVFINNQNSGNKGVGAVSIDFSELYFCDGITTFQDNYGTALLVKSVSRAVFQSEVEFVSNIGINGGAVIIEDLSSMFVNSSSILVFANNEADLKGGAIYSVTSEKGPSCSVSWDMNSIVNVTFRNNKASGMDQSVYITDSNNCSSFDDFINHGFNFIPNISYQLSYPPDEMGFSIVSNLGENITTITLGQRFYLNPINVLDMHGNPSTGIANIVANRAIGSDLQLIGPSTVSIDDFTSNTEFYVKGKQISSGTTINFHIDIYFNRDSTYRQGYVRINITVMPCKFGYRYDHDICVCSSKDSSEVKCLAGGKEFCIQYHYWYSKADKTAYPCPIKNCDYLSKHCPSQSHICSSSDGFCSIERQDDVCREGRTDVLCSLCSNNFSFTLGAYQCVHSSLCTNLHTFLLVLFLIVYWILFAVVILVALSRNLSVGSGFMYGIVYYFSVVTIYTSNNHRYSTLWMEFVINISRALTQLDPLLLGSIKWCFAQSWWNPLTHELLRYFTSFFVIILILGVIFISRHCHLPKKISFAENSPIHAICMLILFSYTSLSCTNYRVLIPTYIEMAMKVKDAPFILYFQDKNHIPYAVLAIFIELFFSLPICFLLLLAPHISKHMNLVKYRLKPILDEFQACYRPECRWFAGFYFLSRQLVYLVNGLFSNQFTQFNSVLGTLNALVLLIHVCFQPYKNIWLNRLDTFLLLDIVLLSLFINDGSKGGLLYDKEVYFRSNILPVCLIILPTLYLCGVICAIFMKKSMFLKLCLCFPKVSEKIKQRLENTTAQKYTNSFVKLNDSFNINEDARLREELLDESVSDQEPTRYGALSYKPVTTTSSLRLFKSVKTY